MTDIKSGYPAGPGCRRRGGQVRFSREQTRHLELCFRRSRTVTGDERRDIARLLHLHERQVNTWFQNRRAKEKRLKAPLSVPGPDARG
nr:hematopoietically-expressed homeobox protein HHEX-like [Procambarus clarkii]